METEAKDLSYFDEEMHPHHLHMFDSLSPKVIGYLVQNMETIVGLNATRNFDIYSLWCHVPVSIFYDNLLPFWRQTWCFFTKQNLVNCRKQFTTNKLIVLLIFVSHRILE